MDIEIIKKEVNDYLDFIESIIDKFIINDDSNNYIDDFSLFEEEDEGFLLFPKIIEREETVPSKEDLLNIKQELTTNNEFISFFYDYNVENKTIPFSLHCKLKQENLIKFIDYINEYPLVKKYRNELNIKDVLE
jgi:hypothetical protein